MDRVIKFRAWDEDAEYNGSKMSYFNLHERDYVLTNGNYPVMQFTGLLDKNGKEIYEGDVVSDGEETFTVIFADGSFGYKDCGVWMSFCHCYTQYGNLEVIGNVFENPELLES